MTQSSGFDRSGLSAVRPDASLTALAGSGSPEQGAQFSRDSVGLADQVVSFLREGLNAGDAAIVIATAPHRRVFRVSLEASGVDVSAACLSNRLIFLDAHETLSQILRDGQPDAHLFEAVVGTAVAKQLGRLGSGRLRAYGEMVDVLWQDGQPDAALVLERLWNGLQNRYSFTLLCGYVSRGVLEQPARAQLATQHTHGPRERVSAITAAIADAVSDAQVFEALVDRVYESVEATSVALWLVDEETGTARLARALGYSDAAKQQVAAVPLDVQPSFPALDAIRRAEAIWIHSQAELLERYPGVAAVVTQGQRYRVSCLPLVAHGRVLGALALTLDKVHDTLNEEQELLLLVARYASQALERLRLFDAERRSRSQADAAALRAEQLYRFAQAVVVADRIESVFDAALDAIERALGAQRAAVLEFDAQKVMRFVAWRNLSDAYRSAVEGHSPWPPDARAPEPVLVSDVRCDPSLAAYHELFRREGIGSLAFFPLVTRGQLLGKFMVYYAEPHEFESHEVETAMAIGNHLASVITRFSVVSRLEETIRSNELFAGVLAHDLRNPLGAIMTAAHLVLARSAGNDRLSKPLTRIQSSGQRMSRMIDQLLDYTRARTGGGIRIQPRESDLSELCRQAIEELELAQPDWTIRSEIVGDQTGSWDPDRLLQVISNLIANAGQHGSRDHAIRVRLDGTLADRLSFHVHNRGAIPAAFLPYVFDPLRTSRHGRGQSHGLGLGLFIVRELVRAHGGSVDLTSSELDGTTFSVHLPRQPGQARSS